MPVIAEDRKGELLQVRTMSGDTRYVKRDELGDFQFARWDEWNHVDDGDGEETNDAREA